MRMKFHLINIRKTFIPLYEKEGVLKQGFFFFFKKKGENIMKLTKKQARKRR